VAVAGEDQRSLFRLWPAGVSVVVAERGGRKAGLTVSSLVSVSLDPPLVSISIARDASIFEVLDEAGRWGVSILAGDQAHLAQHFSRSVPPLVQWDGIPARADEPLLLEGAVGWVLADTVSRVELGDHVIFVGAVGALEQGPGQGSLVYFDRRYVSL
jgi:flavin reductase (DIM6/NTAB) family NADH-FMN oxidoreductase RutF